MKKLLCIMLLTLMSFSAIGQQKWTKKQINDADRIIFNAGGSEEDLDIAYYAIAKILNISKAEAAVYFKDRAFYILASAIEEGVKQAEQNEKLLQQYKEKCISYIKKLNSGQMLSREEVDLFYDYQDLGYRLYRNSYDKRCIFLKAPRIPVARNNKMVFGTGDGTSQSQYRDEYWNLTIKKIGTLTDDVGSISQFTTSYNNEPCIILWKQRLDGTTYDMSLYRLKGNYNFELYSIQHRGDTYATQEFEGFSEAAIQKVKNDSIYIVTNLESILKNSAVFNKKIEFPDFNLQKAIKKKAKPIPAKYANDIQRLYYIGQHKDLDIWTTVDNKVENWQKKEFEIIDKLFTGDKLDYWLQYYKNSTSVKILKNSRLLDYDWMLRDFYRVNIPKILAKNKNFLQYMYIESRTSTYLLRNVMFLVDKKNKQVFLCEGSYYTNPGFGPVYHINKIQKLEITDNLDYLFK